jgi:hypothetical protein
MREKEVQKQEVPSGSRFPEGTSVDKTLSLAASFIGSSGALANVRTATLKRQSVNHRTTETCL